MTAYHKTAADMLAAWDRGEGVWSVEMGGLGPGYEQAIQVLTIELIRDHLGQSEDDITAAGVDWGDATVRRVNDWPGCGFSGAQVGAAKHLAFKMLTKGPDAAFAQLEAQGQKDRMIQVSKTWPREAEEVSR